MPTWPELVRNNPQHSHNYAQRWKRFEAEGRDIVGEARLIDAMVDRRSTIVDAGCGSGRLAGYLAKQGHTVLGVDLDPVLLDFAREDYPVEQYPNCSFAVVDLTKDSIPINNADCVVCAGNVMGFLPENGRAPALTAMFDALRLQGRAVIGFGAGRGYGFEQFLDDAKSAGFTVESTFESWDLKPFHGLSQFIVAILAKTTRPIAG